VTPEERRERIRRNVDDWPPVTGDRMARIVAILRTAEPAVQKAGGEEMSSPLEASNR
jgi:hypothetical protein